MFIKHLVCQYFRISYHPSPRRNTGAAKELILSPANCYQGQKLNPKIQAHCSASLLLSLPFSPAAKTEPRAGGWHFIFWLFLEKSDS